MPSSLVIRWNKGHALHRSISIHQLPRCVCLRLALRGFFGYIQRQFGQLLFRMQSSNFVNSSLSAPQGWLATATYSTSKSPSAVLTCREETLGSSDPLYQLLCSYLFYQILFTVISCCTVKISKERSAGGGHLHNPNSRSGTLFPTTCPPQPMHEFCILQSVFVQLTETNKT